MTSAYAKAAHTLFAAHVPEAAVDYCVQLYFQYRFRLTLRKNRVSKAGDFTWSEGKPVRITVNDNLHPYTFLITYVHEVAHADVHRQFGLKAEPHGQEWKRAFQRLLAPVLNENVFPQPLLSVLKTHMRDPMASSYADTKLTAVLRQYDPNAHLQLVLSQVPFGASFQFNGRWFRKGKLRRTRFECIELKTKHMYLVPVDAPVDQVIEAGAESGH